jgi:hypothetical protein
MWVLVILSSMIGFQFGYTDTQDKCVALAKFIKKEKDPEAVVYCIPKEEWDAGEKGMDPENEVKTNALQ